MITGSDVISYRLESNLERVFENRTYKKSEQTTEEVEIKKNEAHNFKITKDLNQMKTQDCRWDGILIEKFQRLTTKFIQTQSKNIS